MWYFGSIFILIILLSIITIIGRPVCELFPFKVRPSAKLLLSPVIGLSILTLAATFFCWIFRATPYLCIPITLLLTGVAFRFDRNKGVLLKHLFVLWVYAATASGALFYGLLRYNCFNPCNDFFTYLVHSQWLQQHAYHEPAMLSGSFPFLSQVALYQQTGLRMGASFFMSWIQAIFGAPLSYLVCPVAVALPLIAGCLVIGYCASLNSFGRYKPFLVAFFAAVGLNGFTYGISWGFLPQTYGIAFATGSLIMLGIANTRLSKVPAWKEAFVTAIPCALLFSGMVYSYSEIVPFTTFAFVLALAYFLLKRDCHHGLVKFYSAFFVEVAFLVNLEMPRAFFAILTQSKTIVGWPIDWRIIDFAALAFGFRGGGGDDVWLLGSPVVSVLLLAVLLIPLFLNRKALICNRFSQLLPCIAFILISGAFFLYFRYGSTSPWPTGTGQSWNQFKIANWASAFCMILVGLSVLQAAKRPKLHKVLLFILISCSLAGVYWNYPLAYWRTRYFRSAVGSESPFTELTALRNYTRNLAIPDQKIYLEFPPIYETLRRMVLYFLYDSELAGDWSGDVYVGQTPMVPLSSSAYMVKFLGQDVKDLLPRFGNLVFTKTPDCVVRLKSVEGGYGSDADNSGWWNWTSNILRFHYEIEGTKRPKFLYLRYQYFCASSRSIKVLAQGSDSSEEMVIHSQGGWDSYVFEIPCPKDHLDITFTSPEPAVRLSDSDTRMAKFLIKNLEVETPSRASEKGSMLKCGEQLPTTIDFKKSAWPGIISSAGGLSSAEPWGTWSSRDVVTLEFSKYLPEKFIVHLVANAFGPNVGKEFVAHVGDSAVRFTLAGSAESPEERVLEFSNPKGSKIIRIDVPSPCSPKDLGLSNDERTLGIGFTELRVAPLDDFALARAAGATTIDFKKSAWPDAISSTRGLSSSESWGTWSSSDVVTLEFSKALPEKFTIHLVARAFGPNIGKEFVIHVGNSATRFTLADSPEDRVLEFNNPQRSNIIKIDVPSPCSPKKLGLSDDDRSLGVGLTELRIEPL
jgi:hypothetical protein